ncbi:MAG: ATP synthase F1 subunit gamma [Myxococcota bacterium]|nr:ATP synthase F1 subunit gamma [Myxococcota bacterium]
MASLRDIRTRIKSVKNTQKITGAMKLVAASKLRRAQDAIEAARPYASEIGQAIARVGASIQASDEVVVNPLLEAREIKRARLVVMTSDRGLCGGFNASILRRADQFIAEHADVYDEVEIATIGRRAYEHFRKQEGVTLKDYPGVFNRLNFQEALAIAEEFSGDYADGKVDAVYLLYNEFKSAISQVVTVSQLVPVAGIEEDGSEDDRGSLEYIYEPNAQGVLDSLVPRYVATLVWRALLESNASEHGARMSAMDSATKNGKEIEDKLTLQYNRARQANITQELMEIVGGAEALNG